MDRDALKKHKLTIEFLSKHPTFLDQYYKLKQFFTGDGASDSTQILCCGTVGRGKAMAGSIFDSTSLNKECRRVGKPEMFLPCLSGCKLTVIDTNEIACDSDVEFSLKILAYLWHNNGKDAVIVAT